MARTVRPGLALAVALSLLFAAAPAFALEIDKVTGGVTLQDAGGLQAKAVVQAWEPYGVPGTPEYRPAHGTMRMWIGDTETVYDLTTVSVRNRQAMLGGFAEDGTYRSFYLRDLSQPSAETDWFASMISPMRFFLWDITGGNLQIHEY